jgi:hypothetical protein
VVKTTEKKEKEEGASKHSFYFAIFLLSSTPHLPVVVEGIILLILQ